LEYKNKKNPSLVERGPSQNSKIIED